MIQVRKKIITLLLCLPIQLKAIIITSSVLVSSDNKKKIVLFDELHAHYMKEAQCDSSKLNTIVETQEKILSKIAQKLLNLQSTKAASTVMITETNDNLLVGLAEQEAGLTAIDKQDSIEVFPRVFLKDLFTTVEKPFDIFQKKLSRRFNNIEGVLSFELKNNMRWLIGDRRTKQDQYLAFDIYQHWKKIEEWLTKTSEKARHEDEDNALMASLTIETVKNYISTLHTQFQTEALDDQYYTLVMETIDNALSKKEVNATDHFALFHKYLYSQDTSGALRDKFNNNMICFLSQKFDYELINYVKTFESDKNLSCAIIVAGHAHNKMIKNKLLKNGYKILEVVGAEDQDETMLQDSKKMNALIELLQSKSSFVDLQEVIGVNTDDIIKTVKAEKDRKDFNRKLILYSCFTIAAIAVIFKCLNKIYT